MTSAKMMTPKLITVALASSRYKKATATSRVRPRRSSNSKMTRMDIALALLAKGAAVSTYQPHAKCDPEEHQIEANKTTNSDKRLSTHATSPKNCPNDLVHKQSYTKPMGQ